MLEIINESPLLFALVALAAFCGASFQSMFGIGLGMIMSPFLLAFEPRLMPVVPICLGALASLPHACSNLRDLNVQHCAWASAGRVLGVAAGTWLFVTYFSDTGGRAFALLFAGTMLVALLFSSFGRWAKFFTPSVPRLAAASTLAGVMGTMTSIGGPPVALIYRLEPPATGRLHLNFLLGTGALMSLGALGYAGAITRLQLEAAAACVPAALLGLLFARWYADRVSKYFRQAVLMVILVSTCALVIRNI